MWAAGRDGLMTQVWAVGMAGLNGMGQHSGAVARSCTENKQSFYLKMFLSLKFFWTFKYFKLLILY